MGRFELLLLAAWVVVPWAPAPWAVGLLVGLTAAWLATRPPRREAWLAGVGLLMALGALVLGVVRGPRVPADDELRSRLEARYARLWTELDRQAEEAARHVSLPLAGDSAQLELLEHLSDLAGETGDAGGRTTLLVVNPDGQAVVWAGEGLLHELEPPDLPRGGSAFEASFGAVTFLTARPLTPAERPWRVVAARSFTIERLPFLDPWEGPLQRRWSVTGDPGRVAPGAWTIGAGGDHPVLVVEASSPTPERGLDPRPRDLERRLAWGGLALALLALLVLRVTGLVLPGIAEASGPRSPVGPAVAGVAAAGFAAAVPAIPLLALGLGVGIVLWALHRLHQPPMSWPLWAQLLQGAGVAMTAGAAAWAWQSTFGARDLAAGFFGSPAVFALRLALFSLTLGLLVLAGGHRSRPGRERWAWLSVTLLLAGLAFHDTWFLGAVLGLVGSAVAMLWLQDRRILTRPGPLAVTVLIAALISAGTWEAVYRETLRQTLATEVLPQMAPPEDDELAALAATARTGFDGLDLVEIVPREPEGLERRDLAYTLWTRSPLSLANTFSSLVVQPLDGPTSTFSFGLRLNDELVPERPPQRIPEPSLPGWDEARIAGRGQLLYRGRPWARVSWWVAPRPGFRLRQERPQEATGEALLAGGPRVETEVEGLPGSAVYGLYDPVTGRALLSPWTESSPLPPELDRRVGAEPPVEGLWATTPAGVAWAFPRRRPQVLEVLYLPFLTPALALERTGTHSASVLLALGLLVLVGLFLALPRPGFRSLLHRTYRSYSKRLILVYTALLLLPLLSVNVLLVAGAEERLGREQRSAGLAALDSAQRLLVENMLGQQPGFDLKTALDNEELTWLSQVVHHDVNLYWENEVWASSKSELFAAGLLPKRIPGEVHARLDLLGFDHASRTNRVGDTRYLELYSPVRIPGEPVGRSPLALSLPLLAQQEEVARELATLRRQVFLVTAVLFVLLVAVGLRLARSFTEPIDELVEGTRRIAAGARSLDLAPTELELAALVEAIDDMAEKIARGRQRLLREKQVVERIVENITSGVLSLDRERRVLLRNRVAADLLGVDVGTSLEEAADRLPEPVAAFLADADDAPRQKTVRLAGDGEDREWNLVWVPVPGEGEPSALLVVEDATDILRGQRLEAWAEMARIIAHEIKNPLTPIRLNAEHAAMVYESDPEHFARVFERCMGNILSQVAELQQIASEFSTYSSILRIERKPDDLVEAMEELVEPYLSAPPEGVEIRFDASHESLQALFDRRLLTRAVRNLLENALRASADGGVVTLSVGSEDGLAKITVADSGPGVDPALLSRIFDPYFSTHDTGTGLGLPIARRVAEEHDGAIAARNLPDAGLAVAITIPL